MDPKQYHLEALDGKYCNNKLLEIFSRAHMSYINQIFGDETIRNIIKTVYKKRGKLVVLPSGPNFENSIHHVYYYDSDEEVEVPEFTENGRINNKPISPPKIKDLTGGSAAPGHHNILKSNSNVVKNVLGNLVNQVEAKAEEEKIYWDNYSSKVCSVNIGYQDIDVDINDTLCQSYSLMTLLDIDFDTTPSKNASSGQKFKKHLAMINMYRKIISNRGFLREFNKIIQDRDNLRLWEDSVDDKHIFYIIEEFKKPAVIVSKIKQVLQVWEKWGWHYFVGDGNCEKLKQDGGRKRKTLRKSRGYIQ